MLCCIIVGVCPSKHWMSSSFIELMFHAFLFNNKILNTIIIIYNKLKPILVIVTLLNSLEVYKLFF